MLLYQSKSHAFNIEIKENNKDIRWAYFEYKDNIITISNYSKADFGEHNLSILIYDEWFSRYFNSSLKVILSPPLPPSVVGTISNVTAYQGQDIVYLKIDEGLFYDRNERFSIVVKWCTKIFTNLKDSTMNYTNWNDLTLLQITFLKQFIGICESNLIAYDSYMQNSLVTFYFNVLKWPQNYWLYWNGPKLIDWTEWIKGFVLDPSTGEWKEMNSYFDTYVIISFVIVVLLITILSDHDVNASYVILETITFYWMIFTVFNNREWTIKNYFSQITVVITHFNSLIFPLFSWMFKIEDSTKITNTKYNKCSLQVISFILFITKEKM